MSDVDSKMNKISKSSILKLVPFIIFVIAIIIRLYFIRSFPGNVDEIKLAEEMLAINWSEIPIHFVGYGWGENVLLAFLGWIPSLVLNIEPLFALRMIVLVSNIFLLYWIYIVAYKSFGRGTAAIALTFGAIWPWSVLAGILAFNVNVAVTLIAWGAYFFVTSIISKKQHLSYIAAVLFALACYGYILSFIWIALITTTTVIIYGRRALTFHRCASFIVLCLLTTPLVMFYISLQFPWMSLDTFLWFSFPELTSSRITYDGVFTNTTFGGGVKWFTFNYLMHYFFALLVWTPGKSLLSTPLYLAYIWDVVLLYLGLYALAQEWKKYFWLLIAVALFPIASSFTVNTSGYLLTRDLAGMPILILVSAFGARYAITNLSRKKA